VVALEFLGLQLVKHMRRPAVNDISIEVVEQAAPSKGEVATSQDALSCLSAYFRGELGYDVREAEKRMKEEQRKEERRHAEADPRTKSTGTLVACFNCPPSKPRRSCVLCHGEGALVVYPAADRNEEDLDDVSH
jgi:hypothetical protein